MSTLEAVAAALRALGEAGAAARLDALPATSVGLATRLRGVPDLSLHLPEGHPAAGAGRRR